MIQEDQAYINETVSPDLVLIEQKLVQCFDLDKDGLGVDLDESPLLRADPLTRYNLGRIGKLSGLISTNEWRRSERLPPDPDGDTLMQPVNLAALGSDMTGEAPDEAGRPPAGHMPKPGVPNQDTSDDVAKTGGYAPVLARTTRLDAGEGDQPVNLNIQVLQRERRRRVVKRIETRRDAAGNLTAEVVEEEEPAAKGPIAE